MKKEDIVFRARRNELLRDCDWTLIPSSPLSVEKQDEWKVYRQALRDLPETANPKLDEVGAFDPTSVTWPTKPS